MTDCLTKLPWPLSESVIGAPANGLKVRNMDEYFDRIVVFDRGTVRLGGLQQGGMSRVNVTVTVNPWHVL
jgi:hypothetical protein